MLNVIQLMDDEGLGHCKRMVTFAKLISKTGDKIVFLISDKKNYQANGYEFHLSSVLSDTTDSYGKRSG